MKFDRLRIDAYGRLRELDTGPSALPGLVVVHGPNEAGKSTFFHLLNTLLYGFYPASRDRNPYAPWSGEDASASARIRLDDGGCAEVERRLLSSPSARLTREEVESDLRNQSLPWVTHVPRTVFGQVFALTLEELAALDEETWGRVEDRLLGSMGAELVPARTVVSELETEAGSLWRPNRRGNQDVRELQEELRELRVRRREAAERDRDLRALMRRRDEAVERLDEARREREEARLSLERIELLGPVRAQLQRIRELQENAGDPAELEALPADPQERRNELREGCQILRDRLDKLSRAQEEPRTARDALTEEDQTLLDHAATVARFSAGSSARSAARARMESMTQEVEDRERRLATASSAVLAVDWREAPHGPLLALSTPELRTRLRAIQATRQALKALDARPASEASTTPSATPLLLGGLLALLAGLSTMVLAVASSLVLAWAPALLASAAGVVMLWVWRTRSAGDDVAEAEDDTARRELESQEIRQRQGLEKLVRDIPVTSARLEDADPELASTLERMQELLRDREARLRRVRQVELDVEAARSEARELAALVGQDPGLDPEALAGLLERKLHHAERLKDASDAGRRELARLGEEEARLGQALAAEEKRLEELDHELERLGDGDVEAGIRSARQRMEARDTANRLLTELRRGHPQLEELRARIRRAEAGNEAWTMDDDSLIQARTRADSLTAEIEELTRETEALEQELRHGLDRETVDAVDGEIATLEAEESRLLDKRDRLWILAHLVRESDRAFREEHQPDLLRRAGDHMSRLTGGRYTRLVADDGSGEHRFHLVGGDRSELTPLGPPLSTGTLEQAYLALRLAIIDHLDDGQERLPFFLDEALVNWDVERRTRAFDLLAELSETRQTFVFTCHAEMVHELETRGARCIRLLRG